MSLCTTSSHNISSLLEPILYNFGRNVMTLHLTLTKNRVNDHSRSLILMIKPNPNSHLSLLERKYKHYQHK